jgi:hypothetical protein
MGGPDSRTADRGIGTADRVAPRSWRVTARGALLSLPVIVMATFSAPVVAARAIGRDSGVFLYAGQVINSGGVPYIDAWDHKGPLLYLFNAAGSRLTGGDILGVSLLESALLVVGVGAFAIIWGRAAGALAGSLAGVAVALSFYQVFEGGNYSETWSFPFALVAYALLGTRLLGPASVRRSSVPGIALGVAGAVAGLTRPSNGLGLLAVAAWFILAWPHSGSTRVTRAIWVLGSGSVVVLPVALHLAAAGAWGAMWEQYVHYNFVYSGSTAPVDRLIATVSIVRLTMSAPVTLLALIMAIVLLVRTRSEDARALPMRPRSALLALGTAVALDLVGANLSGRGFPHYAVSVLPAIGSIAALLVGAAIASGSLRAVATSATRSLALVTASAMMLVGLGLTRESLASIEFLMRTGLTNPNSTLSTVVSEVQRRTDPDDPIYVWGAETTFLAASKRTSSSSVTYLYPVVLPIGDTDAVGRRLADELRDRPPALVLRSPGWECPFDESCEIAALAEAHAFIARNYRLDIEIRTVEFWVPR